MRTFPSLIFLLAAILFAACGKTPPPPPPPPPGPRIVSTVPAATLNLVLIGAADSLVGVSKYDKLYLPDNKQDLPVVGDYETMNYERLIELQPTAVILQTAESNIPARLRELAASHHFDIINIKLNTTADLWDTVKTLGKISDKQNAADQAVFLAQAQLKELADSLAGKTRPKVLYVVGKDPMYVVAGHNFMDEILTLAVRDNVAASAGTGFIVISNETLIRLAPDVLLISAPGEPEQQANDPRLESWQRYPIPAVKNNRVFLVTDGDALTASVNLPKSIRALSTLIHKIPADHGDGGGKP